MSYIGQTRNFDRRKKEYLREYVLKDNYLFYKDMRKYGVEAFNFQIIEQCSIGDANVREKYWIKELSTQAPGGYNFSKGGNSWAWKNPEEVKRKISKSRLGSKASPETIKKFSIRSSGERNAKAKIKEVDVIRIRSMYIPRKYSYEKIAGEFGLTKSTVHKIVNKLTWRSIK
jgi:group I intron endonuclease